MAPRPNSDRLAFTVFLASTAVLLVVFGAIIGRQGWFPNVTVSNAAALFRNAFGSSHHLVPAVYEFAGARVHVAEGLEPGLTLITSHWKSTDWLPGARLINAHGQTVHHWVLDPSHVWPSSPHDDPGSRAWNIREDYVHGTHLFSNGDLLFNFEYLGLARVNARGEVLWRLPYRTHHSIERDEDGSFWVCGLRWLGDRPEDQAYVTENYPGLEAPLWEERLLRVSADGELLEDINVLAVFMNGPTRKSLWRSGTLGWDPLHVNDVEPLPSAIADQYPTLEAGDLLVSARAVHTIFVVDRTRHEVKWSATVGLSQHDPDFIGDGWIGVFDNNQDYHDGEVLGGSRIVAVRPEDGAQQILYPRDGKNRFFTPEGGKWQLLPNGNMLITEAQRGRVFEVDAEGSILWEWVNDRYDETRIPEVLEGTRYPITEETVSTWQRVGEPVSGRPSVNH